MAELSGRSWLRWIGIKAALVMVILGCAAGGMAAILMGHESRVLVAVAGLVGIFGVMVLCVAWNCARGKNTLVARVVAAGPAGACGLLLLVADAQLVVGSLSGNGVITDAKLAGVFVGETKAEVHHALGNPVQHWLSPDVPSEDCDVYEKDPGLQGGLYANVCYLNGKVDRVLPFR